MVAYKVTVERETFISFFLQGDFSPYAKRLIADPVVSIASTGKKEKGGKKRRKETKSLRVKGRKSDALVTSHQSPVTVC